MTTTSKHTWIELDPSILADNIRLVRDRLRTGTEIISLVKANAYGHGMVPVVSCAWDAGVRWFAVAHLDEALTVRQCLPQARILLLAALDPRDAVQAADAHVTPVVVDREHALALAAQATARDRVLHCHAMLDTGMGRLGFAWSTAAETLSSLRGTAGLELAGLCSHFASANKASLDFATTQAGRFAQAVAACKACLPGPLFTHISNSGAIQLMPQWDVDGVRPGILLYGHGHIAPTPVAPDSLPPLNGGTEPSGGASTGRPLQVRQIPTHPFLQWKTRVLQVKRVPGGFPVSYDRTHVTQRPTHIATIDVGYADGFPRSLSNNGYVIIRGSRCPVVGRVTMNLTTIDVGMESDVAPGDEVVLLGAQGNAAIWADEMAAWRGTIPHEVFTGIRTSDRRIVASDRPAVG